MLTLLRLRFAKNDILMAYQKISPGSREGNVDIQARATQANPLVWTSSFNKR
jgi:hypothetical protein